MKMSILRMAMGGLITLLTFTAVVAQGQNSPVFLKPVVEVNSPSCNENNSRMSILNQYSDRSDLIIIVSRLGSNERKNIGLRRLHNAETFFNQGLRAESTRPLESILLAEGRRVQGKGYLDFFVKGKLELRIFFETNHDLRVPPCVLLFPEEKACSSDFEKLFYPCKSKK